MNKKDTQRKTLAMLVLFFIAYIYVEKVLTPYFSPPPPARTELASAKDQATKKADSEIDSFGDGFLPENAEGLFKDSPLSDSTEGSKLSDNTSISSSEIFKSEDNTEVSLQAKKSEVRKGVPTLAEVKNSGLLTLENDLVKISISKLGGRVQSIELKNFKRSNPNDTELHEMIANVQGMGLPAGVLFKGGSDIWVEYEVSKDEGAEKNEIKLLGTLLDGRQFFKKISLNSDSYFFDLELGFTDAEKSEPFFLEWTKYVELKDSSLLDPYDTDGFVWFNGDKSERLTFNDITKEAPVKALQNLLWLGFGNKYFATAFVYKTPTLEVDNGKNGKVIYPTNAQAERRGSFARALFSSNDYKTPLLIQVFTGPKKYTMLEEAGYELKRLLDLGMTGVISAPLLSLLSLFYKFVGNYGLAIVLLTIAVKFALYPLNASQFKQMKALQALKPELDRIKESIKDRQQQQQALMELYKKKGVNPLGGCLPVLIQMPIFIGLYSALMLSVELRHADFGMWVHDLSAPDRLMIGDFGVPVLVLLFTISMMVQQWITPTAVDPAQKKAMMIMPVVMFFMFMNFPSGLALYWLTNNLFSIGQQRAIQYHDKHGKSGFKITALVALAVFVISWLCTLI